MINLVDTITQETVEDLDMNKEKVLKTGKDLRNFRDEKRLSMSEFLQKLYESKPSRRWTQNHVYDVEREARTFSDDLKKDIKKVKSWE